MIKNIIFDFGGVILKHRATIMEEFISKIFSIPYDQAARIWAKYRLPLMIGSLTSEQLITKLKKELSSEKTVVALLSQWKNLYAKEASNVDWELLDFINHLKKQYPVYLFTDTIDIHDEYNSTRGIYNKFIAVFKSYKEKFSKINDNAFENVLQKIHASPEECVYIDDLPINAERASKLGLKAILYMNLQELKSDLDKLGIN